MCPVKLILAIYYLHEQIHQWLQNCLFLVH
jgi:hypothetical protein